jgi:hypothetical protein
MFSNARNLELYPTHVTQHTHTHTCMMQPNLVESMLPINVPIICHYRSILFSSKYLTLTLVFLCYLWLEIGVVHDHLKSMSNV